MKCPESNPRRFDFLRLQLGYLRLGYKAGTTMPGNKERARPVD